MLRPMRNLQPRSNLTYQEKNLVAFRIVVAAAIMDPKSIVWLAILANRRCSRSARSVFVAT